MSDATKKIYTLDLFYNAPATATQKPWLQRRQTHKKILNIPQRGCFRFFYSSSSLRTRFLSLVTLLRYKRGLFLHTILITVCCLFLLHCGGGNGSGSSEDTSNIFSVSGTIPKSNLSEIFNPRINIARLFNIFFSLSAIASPVPGAKVTHVIAVSAEIYNADWQISQVDSNGNFHLKLKPQFAYVLILIDSSKVGTNMIAAVFLAGPMHTIMSLSTSSGVDLGNLNIDSTKSAASMGIDYNDFLAKVGLSSGDADTLGALDNLALRHTNVDVDGDGVLDILENHRYMLNFHVRANILKGPNGSKARISDITDKFFNSSGSSVATPVFNLTSFYAEYLKSVDNTEYVTNQALTNSGQFKIITIDGSTPPTPDSYSSHSWGSNLNYGFGPDYNWDVNPNMELPGASGSPVTLVYTLGQTGKTLTFSNVITRTRASLTANGTIMPFIKLNTDSGKIQSISYQWMKRASSTSWIAASKHEIDRTTSNAGGYISVHLGAWSKEIGFPIAPQEKGTINWPQKAPTASGLTDAAVASATTNDICGLAVSYDDKLGLRIFAGGADPNEGVSCPQ